MRKLTESEHYRVAAALRVAAEQYEKDAAVFRARIATADHTEPLARLVRQFEDQATLATKLADEFEEHA